MSYAHLYLNLIYRYAHIKFGILFNSKKLFPLMILLQGYIAALKPWQCCFSTTRLRSLLACHPVVFPPFNWLVTPLNATGCSVKYYGAVVKASDSTLGFRPFSNAHSITAKTKQLQTCSGFAICVECPVGIPQAYFYTRVFSRSAGYEPYLGQLKEGRGTPTKLIVITKA